MTIMSGQDLGRDLCEALGIDPMSVTDMTIECHVGGAATVTYKAVRNVDTRSGERMRKSQDSRESRPSLPGIQGRFEIVRSFSPIEVSS
jgi:hypothetical protein